MQLQKERCRLINMEYRARLLIPEIPVHNIPLLRLGAANMTRYDKWQKEQDEKAYNWRHYAAKHDKRVRRQWQKYGWCICGVWLAIAVVCVLSELL